VLKTMEAWQIITGEEKMPDRGFSSPLHESEKRQDGNNQPSASHRILYQAQEPSSGSQPTIQFRKSSAVSRTQLRCGFMLANQLNKA